MDSWSAWLSLFGAAVAGAGLGLFYFWGLWLTIRRLHDARQPSLWLIASFFGRSALTLLGFYLILMLSWIHLVIALVTFVLVRIYIAHRLRASHPHGKRSEL